MTKKEVQDKEEPIQEIRRPTGGIHPKSTYILGVDLARFGADETALVVVEQLAFGGDCFVCFMETYQGQSLSHTIGRVKQLDKMFNFKRVMIDETGLGAGVVDSLKESVGHRIEGVTFTQDSKSEMFTNLKLMMQQKKLIIQNKNMSEMGKKLVYELLIINQEVLETGKIKLSHDERSHDDLVCALALAAFYFKPGRKMKRGYSLAGGSRS